jgi:hypothetical protein
VHDGARSSLEMNHAADIAHSRVMTVRPMSAPSSARLSQLQPDLMPPMPRHAWCHLLAGEDACMRRRSILPDAGPDGGQVDSGRPVLDLLEDRGMIRIAQLKQSDHEHTCGLYEKSVIIDSC